MTWPPGARSAEGQGSTEQGGTTDQPLGEKQKRGQVAIPLQLQPLGLELVPLGDQLVLFGT
ncbi:hypothetical protein AB5I41_00115 [Sphingomonas sp. MMS24-JH45]